MVTKFEAQLAEIQSALAGKNSESEDEAVRHPEAKRFDRLTLDEKLKLVAFNARMS